MTAVITLMNQLRQFGWAGAADGKGAPKNRAEPGAAAGKGENSTT